METEPLVSVLVASFNHERYVEQALDSVVAQSYLNLELIIVDDCSTDQSVDRIRRWMDRTGQPTVLIVNEENRGICAVLNQLLARSSGEYCVLLDTDDWMEPDRVLRHVDHFASLDPDVVLVFGDAAVHHENGRSVGESFLSQTLGDESVPDGAAVFDRLLKGNFIPTSTVTVRRSAITDAGGYDESLSFDDYEMWLRLSHRSRFSYCDEIVANYRVVASSMSHSDEWMPSMARSTITILQRWAAVDDVQEVPSRCHAVAGHLRRVARSIAPFDAASAQGALRTAEQLVPSFRWRMIDQMRVFHWPGGAALVEGTRALRRSRASRQSASAA